MDDLTPITREETFLSAAGGQSVTLPEPLTREELFLAKAAGESVETPEPITRREMFLNAIQGGGGGGVTVEPLNVTENGTYTAEEETAYSPVSVNVPQVSGNPNYVETIAGTLANPWGEYAFADLLTAHGNHDLSMYLTSDDLPYTISPVGRAAMKRRFVCVNAATASSVTLAAIDYTSTGGFSAGRIYTYVGGTMQITDIDPTQACTLTIIHHPMTGAMQMAESATFGGNA